MIDSYYLYEKVQGSKTKYILRSFSNKYEPMHQMTAKKEHVIYLSERPDFINSKLERKPQFTLDSGKMNGKKSFHTGIYFEPNERERGFGDFKNDLILVELFLDSLEVFVCKNSKPFFGSFYSMFIEHDETLEKSMKDLRTAAIDVE